MIATSTPTTLSELATSGGQAFERLGFPNRKHEAWRYTSTRAFAQFGGHGLSPPDETLLGTVAKRLSELSPGPEDGARFVFVGGTLVSSLSSGQLPQGVSVSPLSEADLTDLGSIATSEEDAFVALNTSHLTDGLAIDVERGSASKTPIEIIHVAIAGDAGGHPRVLLRAAPLSEVIVVERFVSLDDQPSMTNAVIEISATGGAHVLHAQLIAPGAQATHKGHIGARVGRDSRFQSHVFSLGGSLARTDLHVQLAEPGASCSLDGLYLARGKEQLDHYVQMDHAAPHTTSEAYYKGVVDDQGVGGFVGRVLIARGANGSSSEQLNNNLLLSNEAFAHTRPQLEIDNDDVKASHGSTVGQLDQDALFYLESRGLPRNTARAMLTLAFAKQMTHRLPLDYLKNALKSFISSRLSGAADGEILAAFHEDL
jgi:Fe-S cluster assembly protein SufD